MGSNRRNAAIVACVGIFWMALTLVAWLHPSQGISESERRKLAQMPQLGLDSVLSGRFMKDFEEYAKDQFPSRFGFRTIKAYTRFYLLSQNDNNNIYIEDGYAAKLEYPLRENSVQTATKRFQYLYEKYMQDKDINAFVSVIPDKNYYLGARKGYPSMDYERLFSLVKDGTSFAEYIDLTQVLTIEDYYKTDTHWKQENLEKAARRIGAALGMADGQVGDFEQIATDLPFYGVYYGQAALPLKPDRILYLTNDTIESSTVYHVETDSFNPVYDTRKLGGRDPYEVYLSGASALLVIENPKAQTDKELVVFRDSFGSSLIPLLLQGYSKITMVDIRYISSDLVGNYVEFDDQDVLFLYSTLILNSASSLK